MSNSSPSQTSQLPFLTCFMSSSPSHHPLPNPHRPQHSQKGTLNPSNVKKVGRKWRLRDLSKKIAIIHFPAPNLNGYFSCPSHFKTLITLYRSSPLLTCNTSRLKPAKSPAKRLITSHFSRFFPMKTNCWFWHFCLIKYCRPDRTLALSQSGLTCRQHFSDPTFLTFFARTWIYERLCWHVLRHDVAND